MTLDLKFDFSDKVRVKESTKAHSISSVAVYKGGGIMYHLEGLGWIKENMLALVQKRKKTE